MGANRIDILPVVSRANVHKLEGVVTLQDVLDSYGVTSVVRHLCNPQFKIARKYPNSPPPHLNNYNCPYFCCNPHSATQPARLH
jgi:hypothetical protein